MNRARNSNYVYLYGTRVLTLESTNLVSWEPATDHRSKTPVGAKSSGTFASLGKLVGYGRLLYDLESDHVVGRYEGSPLALSADTHFLVSTGPSPEPDRLIPLGPLKWRAPLPNKP